MHVAGPESDVCMHVAGPGGLRKDVRFPTGTFGPMSDYKRHVKHGTACSPFFNVCVCMYVCVCVCVFSSPCVCFYLFAGMQAARDGLIRKVYLNSASICVPLAKHASKLLP
jgi:hypothetical protein